MIFQSSYQPLYRTGKAMVAAKLIADDSSNPEAFATLNEDAAPRRVAVKNTSRGEKEDPGAAAAREAFFSSPGPTQPPGGKRQAWARRMAGKAVGR